MRKILLHNVGYFRGMNGSLGHALKYWPRLFYVPHDVQRSAIEELGAIIDREKPDVAAVVEVNRGSLDNGYLNQAKAVARRFHTHASIVKYDPATGHDQWWFLSGKANALYTKESATFEHFYLRHGLKRLVLVARLPDIVVYCVHLATVRPDTRARQLEELAARLMKEKGPAVVCGDFNVFGGTDELEPLAKAGFVPTSDEKTFTAAHPSFALDLFLVPRALAGSVRTRVLSGVGFSDHLPVILEIDG